MSTPNYDAIQRRAEVGYTDVPEYSDEGCPVHGIMRLLIEQRAENRELRRELSAGNLLLMDAAEEVERLQKAIIRALELTRDIGYCGTGDLQALYDVLEETVN